MQADVDISPDGRQLILRGGHPAGRDSLHERIAGWAGWKRMPVQGATSVYSAPLYLSTLAPLTGAGGSLSLRWTPAAREASQRMLEAALESDRALRAAPAPTEAVRWRAAPSGRVAMPHQVQVLRALHERLPAVRGLLLTDDMGLGKTTTALLAWRLVLSARRALVICPKSVKLNWADEVAAVCGDTVRCYVYDGTAGQRASVITFMVNAMDSDLPAVAIVNYDMLRTLPEIARSALQRWVKDNVLICDEFHYCKDYKAKRTLGVRELAALSAFRMGLTGTPVRNTVEDLFAQVEILQPGTWTSYHDFARRHLVIVPTAFNGSKRKRDIVRGGRDLDGLNRVMQTIRIGRKKGEVLTLPPKIVTTPKLELEGRHLQVYNTLRTFATVELEKLLAEDASITLFNPRASSALHAMMRCEMLAQGFLSGLPEEYMVKVAPLIADHAVRVEGYESAFVFPDSAKPAWLKEAVEAVDGKLVIFSRFNAPLFWLRTLLEGCEMLVGSMDAVARATAIKRFQTDPSVRFMACQVKLAEGFNLTQAQDVFFLGRDWSPAINDQAEARCHRIGTVGTVNVQVPVVMNTVEKFLDRKLKIKQGEADVALKDVKLADLIDAL